MVQNANGVTKFDEADQPQFMSLRVGSRNFLVEQSSIAAIETLSRVDCNNPSELAAGWLPYKNTKLPVYSFTDQFDLEHSVSDSKAMCVVLKHQEPCVAMMCTEATPFKHIMYKISPLPECIKASPNPIESIGLSEIDESNAVVFVISARSLVGYIENCGGGEKGAIATNERLT